MWIFKMLTFCVFVTLFCVIMSESLSQLTDISQKLDYIINDLKEKDILDGCELPEDKNVVTTVIGSKLYENPEYIRKNLYANFRCKVPSLFQFRGEPKNMKCNGPDSERIVNPQCVPLTNETEWQAAMLKLDWERSLCYNGSMNSSEVFKDPLSRSSYFECVFGTLSQSYKFVSQNCYDDMDFDYDLKCCVSYSKSDEIDFTEIGLKPSIIVNATGSAWDSLGWLLVERGSNVTLDCIYPKVAGSNVIWYKNDFGNTDIYDRVQISGQWISEYRNRIVLNEVDYNNTGIYTCKGVYYTRKYYSETNSHAVEIALKEKRCLESPLPDFELHHKYYRDYPFMKLIKKRCQEAS